MKNILTHEINIDTRRLEPVLIRRMLEIMIDGGSENEKTILLDSIRSELYNMISPFKEKLGIDEGSSIFEIMEVIDNNQVENRLDSLAGIIHTMLLLISPDYTVTWELDATYGVNDFNLNMRDGKIDSFVSGFDLDFADAFLLLHDVYLGKIKCEGQKKITLSQR